MTTDIHQLHRRAEKILGWKGSTAHYVAAAVEAVLDRGWEISKEDGEYGIDEYPTRGGCASYAPSLLEVCVNALEGAEK